MDISSKTFFIFLNCLLILKKATYKNITIPFSPTINYKMELINIKLRIVSIDNNFDYSHFKID